MCRSRRELSNAYLLAKFGFDTAENEPCKICPPGRGRRAGRGEAGAGLAPAEQREAGVPMFFPTFILTSG